MRIVVEVRRQRSRRLVERLALLGAHVAGHQIGQLCLRHGGFSLPDQRAERRDIDGLAAVDAGQDGTKQVARRLDFAMPLVEGLGLRGDEAAKIDRPTGAELVNLREREPRALHRDNLMQPLELDRPVMPPARRGAQRPDQSARLVEAQRPHGEPGQSSDFGNVERIGHAAAYAS